jgi:hypothetical protein
MSLDGGGNSSSGETAGKNAFLNSGGGTSPTKGGNVYMGAVAGPTPGIPRGPLSPKGLAQLNKPIGIYKAQPIEIPATQALTDFDHWSGKQLNDFIAHGIMAGQLQDDAGPVEAQKLWKKLVDRSQAYTTAGRKISPWDVLSMYLTGQQSRSSSADAWVRQGDFEVNRYTGEKRYVGPHFKTTYQQQVDLTDPVTAKAIATSVFQQLMGRDPGKGELGTFAGALNTAESNSPIVQQTTTEYDMNTGEAVGTKSSSKGGFGANAKQYLAEQQVKGKKEYGAVQAATTYKNALDNAVFNNPYGG